MTNIDRREFLKTISASFLASALPFEDLIAGVNKQHVHRDYSKIPVPNVGYREIVKESDLRGRVSLADRTSDIGRIQRTLRWKDICQAVGSRYNVPSRILLGMICVESYGDPTQPNALGDGGVGLIHMQPLLASQYGLRMITNSRRLRDFSQGRKIEKTIDTVDADLKELREHDDRFHPIKNIDAAARMLCDHYERTHSWNRTLERYAGRRTYDSNVMGYVREMASRRHMNGVRADFSRRNRNSNFKGKPLTFDGYLAIFHNLNRNYGLDEYRKLPRYPVK